MAERYTDYAWSNKSRNCAVKVTATRTLVIYKSLSTGFIYHGPHTVEDILDYCPIVKGWRVMPSVFFIREGAIE